MTDLTDNNICEGGPCPGLQFQYSGPSQQMNYKGGHYQKSATKNTVGQCIWNWCEADEDK